MKFIIPSVTNAKHPNQIATKHVVLVELTVPWESNIPKDHNIKLNKYCNLVDRIVRNGFKTDLFAVEVGARGLPAKSLYSLFKNLGLPRSTLSSYMERASKTSLEASYRIWIEPEFDMDLSSKAMETLKKLGVGRRELDDPFFDDKPPPRLGMYDLDDENLCHEVVLMTCSVPGCSFAAQSLLEHASHYDAAHRYACAHCRRLLPSPHLLDLHLQETHDSFFAVMAERRPSYCCYTEECKEKFQTADERFNHCVKVHRLPKDFRFQQSTKKSHKKGKSKKKAEKMEISEEGSGNTEEMSSQDVTSVQNASGGGNLKGDQNVTSGQSIHHDGPATSAVTMVPRHFSFGHSKTKTFAKPSFLKFTGNENREENHVDMDDIAMDLKESLPE